MNVCRCSCTQSELEVSGQIYTLAISPPGKNPPVHIKQETGWAPEPVWAFWGTEWNVYSQRH